MMAKLDGKTSLVTGAGRGIGRAIALKLASEGAQVALNDLDSEPAQAVAAEIEAAGGKAIAMAGDITAGGFADEFVKATVDAFGGLDIVVNNAGYSWDTVIQKTTDEQFDAMLDIHVKAPFKVLRAFASPLREMARAEVQAGTLQNRKVVNITSIGGLFGNAGQIGYASGKTALIGLTKTLAKEWGRYGVNVNCVGFGLIQTRMTEVFEDGKPNIHEVGGKDIPMGVPPEFVDSMRAMIPLGRPGSPEDAANAVYLFCIPESDYISGEVVLASGGLVI